MKILSAKQIREADIYTIRHEPIASVDLMERAATTCFKWIVQHFDSSNSFKVFCGTGNNGGDGLAIARMLHNSGYDVSVYIVRSGKTASGDFKINEARLRKAANADVTDVHSPDNIPGLKGDDILIDALLGTGLNKAVKDLYAEVIKLLNQSKAIIISVDMPSGLFADVSSVIPENQIVKAAYTLSFQLYKSAFLFAENEPYLGKVILLPIGLNEKFISTLESHHELTEDKNILDFIKKRSLFSHKGNFGHAAIIAGSRGKMGAAVLASRACLRTGAGLLTAIVPGCGYEIMQTALPDAMTECDENKNIISSPLKTGKFNAIGVGPGIGTAKETASAIKQMIRDYGKPMVFDADAINIIAENKTWFDFIPADSIFTPHPKEFERLAGKSSNHFERNKLQIEFSKRHNVYVILKGRFTCISCPDGMCYFNPTGNPGMSKGGSGDVLTGMLTALLAQGYTSKQACIAGVYLHGLAADIAVKETGEYSLLASDIADHIGNAFLQLLPA